MLKHKITLFQFIIFIMRLNKILIVLVLISCLLIQQTNQFTFPKLEFSRLKQELKKTGKRIVEKFSFVNWIINKVKTMTNTKKDVSMMVTNAVDKYWTNRKLTDLHVDDLDRHQQEFTRYFQGEIDNFQDYLIKLYRIDTSDADFIRHIKADPDRFFLNYDAYHLLRGLDIASLEDRTSNKASDATKAHNRISDYQL